jgi:hypothetical protein
MLLRIDDAEYHLQVLSDARSPAALQLLGYASAAQRVAGVSRLVPHALPRLLQPEDRLALGEGDPHPLPARPALRPRARERRPGRIRCAGPSGAPVWQPPTDNRTSPDWAHLTASPIRSRMPRAGPEKAAGISPPEPLRQLGDVGGDAPGLVAGEELGRPRVANKKTPSSLRALGVLECAST